MVNNQIGKMMGTGQNNRVAPVRRQRREPVKYPPPEWATVATDCSEKESALSVLRIEGPPRTIPSEPSVRCKTWRRRALVCSRILRVGSA